MKAAASPDLAQVTHKVIVRLVPFVLLMYVLAFLDRANIGFAKQTFQLDTGLSDGVFALGAGLFFIGYALFEVPSNLIMHRVGARVWMCRIMVTWGLISAGLMFATNEAVFYTLRFLLGASEAGFFPGIIYYFTQWIPKQARTRVLGMFYFGVPLAFILGGPLSGWLLDMHGSLGLKGWELMFLIEGLMAVAVGIWAYWYLDSTPQEAKWLSDQERHVLALALSQEEQQKLSHGPSTAWRALTSAKVLYFCLIYFCIQISVYGVIFYLPTQVGALMGQTVGLEVGVVSAIPWVCALAAAYFIPRLAERSQQHMLIAVCTLALSGVGIAVSAHVSSALIALIALCVAASGFISVQPLFWSFPTNYLGGIAAASGIALINSLGNLGGFVAPILRTWAEQFFASSTAGLSLLALSALIGSALFLGMGRLLKPPAALESASLATEGR